MTRLAAVDLFTLTENWCHHRVNAIDIIDNNMVLDRCLPIYTRGFASALFHFTFSLCFLLAQYSFHVICFWIIIK